MKIDFTISFTDNQWLCYNDATRILADSLDELDDGIEKYLKEKYKTGTFNIAMYFDFDRFPQWHRQYMPHYFNRDLVFNLN
jgi:hypothetical protein